MVSLSHALSDGCLELGMTAIGCRVGQLLVIGIDEGSKSLKVLPVHGVLHLHPLHAIFSLLVYHFPHLNFLGKGLFAFALLVFLYIFVEKRDLLIHLLLYPKHAHRRTLLFNLLELCLQAFNVGSGVSLLQS